MKAWRQKVNQEPVKAQSFKDNSGNPKWVPPSRWGRVTKAGIIKWPSFPSALLMQLLNRAGLLT